MSRRAEKSAAPAKKKAPRKQRAVDQPVESDVTQLADITLELQTGVDGVHQRVMAIADRFPCRTFYFMDATLILSCGLPQRRTFYMWRIHSPLKYAEIWWAEQLGQRLKWFGPGVVIDALHRNNCKLLDTPSRTRLRAKLL